MKFTPEQVIEMAREAGVPAMSLGPMAAWPEYIGLFDRLCTLAADRALEAAAAKADEPGVYTRHDMQSAIRAMKEHQ